MIYLLTVVAPEMMEGGTDDGPIEMAPNGPPPIPYSAAKGIGCACWWWTGQGSPSQVCDIGGAAAAAVASIGTDCTDRIEPLGAIKSWGGAIGPIICGWIVGYPGAPVIDTA